MDAERIRWIAAQHLLALPDDDVGGNWEIVDTHEDLVTVRRPDGTDGPELRWSVVFAPRDADENQDAIPSSRPPVTVMVDPTTGRAELHR